MKWITRLFGKPAPKKPVPKLPPINEDWRAGDMALCIVDDSHKWGDGDQPAKGARYIVSDVFAGTYNDGSGRDWGLRLVGMRPPSGCYGFPAPCFRKVPPPAFEEPRVTHQRITRKETVRA